jgi:hypothetical protein
MPPKLNLTDEQLQAIVVARKNHDNWDMTLVWFRDKYKQTVVTDARQLQRKFNTMMKKRAAKGKEVKDRKKGGNRRDGPMNQWANETDKNDDDDDSKVGTDVEGDGDDGKAEHTETTATDTTPGGHENKKAKNEDKTPPPPSPPPPSSSRQPDGGKTGDGTRTNSNPNHNPNLNHNPNPDTDPYLYQNPKKRYKIQRGTRQKEYQNSKGCLKIKNDIIGPFL